MVPFLNNLAILSPNLTNFKLTSLVLGKRIPGFLLYCLLSACTTVPDTSSTASDQNPATQPDSVEAGHSADELQKSESVEREASENQSAQGELSAELLYDILLSNIAAQRGYHTIALESLTRAAYLSRDKDIIADAIQLATQIQDYKTAIELSQLLNQIDPDNYHVLLALANAQFEIGENEIALKVLIKLARQQSIEKEAVLQEIASLIAKQENSELNEIFYKETRSDSKNAQLALTAAILASQLNQSDQFEQFINQSLINQPDWETAALLKIIDLANRSPQDIAIYADQFLEAYPESNRFRLQYARILIQQQQLETALTLLQDALEQNPQSPDALFTIGLIYLEKDMLDEAEESLVSFLKINPKHDQTRIYLSDITLSQARYQESARYLRQVTANRYYLDAQIRLSRVLVQSKSMESGIEHLQQINVQSEEDQARVILEQDSILREHDLLSRSKELLDESLKRFPNQPDLLYNRGLLAAQLDLLTLHEQDMRTLIGLQPDNAHAYNALGYTLADKTDRLDEAMELVTKANNLLPDNAFILDSLGWIHFRRGDNQIALEFLKRAIDIRPDAEIAAHLGEVLWIVGNKQEAQQIWQQGKEWDIDNPVLLDTIERLSQHQQSFFEYNDKNSDPGIGAKFSPPLFSLKTSRALSFYCA